MTIRAWLPLILLLALSAGSTGSRAADPKNEDCADCGEARFGTRGTDPLGSRPSLAALELGAPSTFNAGQTKAVKKANCRRKAPFTTQEIDTWISDFENTDPRTESRKISGIQFENENKALLGLFEKLTTKYNFFGERKSSPSLKSSCQKVRCAMQELFGKKEGPQLLMLLGRYGFNGSHLSWEDSSAWKSDELNDILLALSDYPSSLMPVETNHQLIHYERNPSKPCGSGKTLANATIMVFSVWDCETHEEKQSSLFHEVAHLLGGRSNLDFSKEWLDAGGWEVKIKAGAKLDSDTYAAGDSSRFASRYAMKNPAEDFAESVVAYRYNPEDLKKRAPDKYTLLKEVVFDGIEYTSPKSCGGTPASAALIAQAGKQIEQAGISPSTLQHAMQACGDKLLAEIRDGALPPGSFSPPTRQCLAGAAIADPVAEEILKKSEPYAQFKATAIRKQHFAGTSAKLRETIATQARGKVEELMIKMVRRADFSRWNRLSPELKTNAEKFCADSYHGTAWLALYGGESTDIFHGQSFPTDLESKLESFAVGTCVQTLSNHSGTSPVSDEEVRKQIIARLER